MFLFEYLINRIISLFEKLHFLRGFYFVLVILITITLQLNKLFTFVLNYKLLLSSTSFHILQILWYLFTWLVLFII